MNAARDDTTLSWVLSTTAARDYERLLTGDRKVGDESADELIQTGFAFRDPTNGQLRAMPPELPIVQALAGLAHQWLEAMPAFDAAERDLRNLAMRDSRYVDASRPKGHHIEELTTRRQRAAANRSALANARFELCCFQPEHGHPAEQLEIAPAPVELLARGVRIRFLYEKAALDDESFLIAALEEADLGVEARVVDELPINMALVDRALVVLNEIDDDRAGIMTSARAIVGSYQALFDFYWTRGTPIGTGWVEAGTEPLSTTHKLVLSHVLAGRTADTIGRLLKVDSRTVRRRIDDLCAYYGVETRAALIAAALARHRID